ncbi:MAG TPA: adenylate/guanylate cyclase domain-containing protein [Solirubrobacteraceae bacterium]|nr:adenylate/guanylate cyclase domain-containing protein [Solirubrobacteraceae bacterium]
MKHVLIAILVAVAVGALLKEGGVLREQELATVDLRFDVRGATEPPSDVVIVAMDQRTLDEDPNTIIPFNRHRHARVIKQLTAAGARVIAYDVQFTEESDYPAADEALIEATRASPRVVMATTEVAPDGSTAIFGGPEGLKYSKATPANGNIELDGDGVLRRMRFSAQRLDTFAMAAARLQTGRPIPTGDRRDAWIDWPGPPGTIDRLSFVDVEYGRFPASAVQGKVVVVGATAEAFKDFHATAAGDDMSGPETQAAAIATALRGFSLDTAPGWVDWLLLVALAAVAPLTAMRFGTAMGLVAGLVALVLFLVAAQVAFGSGVIVEVLPPVSAAVTGMVGALLLANPVSHPWVNRALDALSRHGGLNHRTRRLRALLLICTGLSVAVGALLLDGTDALQRLELTTVNERFDMRGPEPPPSNMVVVAVDDKTFSSPPQPQWPFDRRLHARVIRQLTRAGARVIAYDIQFTEPSDDPDADDALIEAVRASPRVVLATTEVGEGGTTSIFGGGVGLRYSRATPAYSNVALDEDDRVRRLIFESPEGLASFPIASARLARGHPVETPGEDSAWVDFAGPPPSIERLSFTDVMKGRFAPQAVRGKVIVVGATAPSLQDLHGTSTTKGGLMPGPEVHANAIATALANFPLRSSAWWLNALLVVLLAVAAPFAALRLRMAWAITIGIAAIVALLVGAQLAFEGGTIVTVVYPLVAGLAALAATAAIHGITVAFERANTREAFARFVPEAVVDEVLRNADGARLGGVQREGTVMFSDLRGFTSFSETLAPATVIDALNRYLTEMSEAILDHGGTLVAYMGDGIMAVFGAPLQQDDHADRALAAARDMLTRLERFNAWLREAGLHDGFKMGIGLNTGPVMSGHVGSERRLEYTALGDTTNTAARLEGMTKGTPYQLYVADSTRSALRTPAPDVVEVGEFEVRGRKATIKLWSLAEDREPEPQDETAVEAT